MEQKSHQDLISSQKFNTKKILQGLLLLILSLNMNFTSRACSPLAVPVLLNQSFSGNNLLLDWESENTWACPGYSVEVEISCNGVAFTGAGPFFWSPTLNKTTSPQAYPQQTVDISSLCPGTTYQFRAREVELGQSGFSGWTSTFNFTTPGTFVPPTLNVSASNNIVCPPQITQLNVSINNGCGGPFSYTWSPANGLSNPSVSSPTANPSNPTLYSVIVSGGPLGCWTANGSINILTGSDPPVAGAGSATPAIICAGRTTTLVLASYTGNIQWQSAPSGSGPWTNMPGAFTNSFVTSPASSLCYKALVSSCVGSVTSNVFCVTVDAPPVLVPTAIQASCQNSVATANLGNPGSSGSPVSATWTPIPNTLGSQSTIATYTNPGVVSFTAAFSDGCVSSAALTLTPVPPSPTFAILNVTGSPSITCSYPTVDLAAVSNYTFGSIDYYWSSASFTANTQSVTINSAALYSVTLTDLATGCSVTHSIAIYLNNAIPNISASPTSQNVLCGPGIVATATGVAISPSINVTQCWYPPGGGSPSCSGGQISIFNPPIVGANGTSTLVITDNINGCSNSRTVEVISLAGGYPVFSVASFSSANQFTLGCGTKTITDIDIVGPDTYPSSGGAVSFTVLPPSYSSPTYSYNTFPLTYTANTAGIYTVIVRDDFNQCETRLPLSVVQNTLGPDVSVSAVTRTLTCDVPSITLTAVSPNVPVTYSWKRSQVPPLIPGNVLPVDTSYVGTTSTPSGTLVDTYTLTGTNTGPGNPNANQCSTTTLIPIWQNIRAPKPIISNAGPINCLINLRTLTNASSTGILPGTFFVSSGPVVSLWEGPSPQQPQTGGSSYAAYTPGPYTMTVRDGNNGCTSFTTASIADNRVFPTITVDRVFPLDCGNATTTITAAFVPSVGLLYKWNAVPGAAVGTTTNSVLLTNSPGEYQIVATDPTNGCSSYSLVEVVNGSLTADFTPDKTTGFAPLTVNFSNTSASTSTATGTSSITSVWSFGNGSTKTNTSNVSNTVTYAQPGTYTVTMFAQKGSCADTVVKVIFVDIPSKLEVPNVFTPNGDNSNDIFFIHTANLSQISAYIYDRWGNKIYELSTDKGNIAWDGKTQTGKEAPDGTYFYIITAKGKDGQSYDTKGTVSLYR